jgi:hypothetical protein
MRIPANVRTHSLDRERRQTRVQIALSLGAQYSRNTWLWALHSVGFMRLLRDATMLHEKLQALPRHQEKLCAKISHLAPTLPQPR